MRISFLLMALYTMPAFSTEIPTYSADIEPILKSRCIYCHYTGKLRPPLGLTLDSLAGLLQGSQNGPVVQAGDPDGSELIRRLKGASQPRMPLIGTPLSEAEIILFIRWIKCGLPEKVD